MDRIARLLERGYFPSQVPPCFTTADLARNHAVLYQEWLALQPPQKNGPTIAKAPECKAESFSVARAGYQRRLTSVPNPIAQAYLATHIVANWVHLIKHYRQSKVSRSQPRFLRGGERGISIPSMELLYETKVTKSAGYRYMLRTDVSRFFPTIYTHSIPWALHGKAAAKRNRKITPKYFGNLLDQSFRQCQDGQTIGIPIGPDTSHIIAEVIATSVDLELRKRLKALPAGFRYVDDYYFFFSTTSEAEACLAALTRSLKEYELHINAEKTHTCSVLEITEDYWPHRIRSASISKNGRMQLKDIHYFFELSKDLARKNADENVMKYALKRASSVVIRKRNWDAFEAHLCHIGLAFPNTLQTLAGIFCTYNSIAYPLDKQRIGRMLNAVIEEHAPLGHHGEVAWSLWLCKKLEIQLSSISVDFVSEMHSSICALVLLDLDMSGKLPKPPRMGYWKSVENADALYGDLWLLSYEAGLRKWGGFVDSHIAANPYFAFLKAKNVRFYDESADMPAIFRPKENALESKGLSDFSDLFDLEDEDIDRYVVHERLTGDYGDVMYSSDDESEDDLSVVSSEDGSFGQDDLPF